MCANMKVLDLFIRHQQPLFKIVGLRALQHAIDFMLQMRAIIGMDTLRESDPARV